MLQIILSFYDIIVNYKRLLKCIKVVHFDKYFLNFIKMIAYKYLMCYYITTCQLIFIITICF